MFIICLKSSHEMGMGHLFRMINLYRELRRRGQTTVFVLLGEHRPAEEWLTLEGAIFVTLRDLQSGWEAAVLVRFAAKVWINDRLDTDEEHVLRLKALGLRIVTFDDEGSGACHTDIHVDALSPAKGEAASGRRVLAGMDYLIVPKEVGEYRRLRTSLQSLVVSMGGSDTYGMTVKVVSWLQSQQRTATVILGPGFTHQAALNAVSNGCISIKRSVPSLAAEFATHDLAITGGGLTSFEAAAAGLPTLTVASEPHEVGYCRYLQTIGCTRYAGYRGDADFSVLNTPFDIQRMSRVAMDNVSFGGAENVCNELIGLTCDSPWSCHGDPIS